MRMNVSVHSHRIRDSVRIYKINKTVRKRTQMKRNNFTKNHKRKKVDKIKIKFKLTVLSQNKYFPI